MKKAKHLLQFLGILLCLFVGLWVAQDNAQPVEVRLVGFALPPLPLGLWLLIMLSAGVVLGMLASLPAMVRARSDRRRYEQSRSVRETSRS